MLETIFKQNKTNMIVTISQQELIQKFTSNPSYLNNGAGYLAIKFNTTKEEIKTARTIARSLILDAGAGIYIAPENVERTTEISNEKGTLKSTINSKFDPKNEEELAALHKIDLVKYKISNYWSKLKPNGDFNSSVLAVLRKVEDMTGKDIITTLDKYTSKYQPLNKKDLILNHSFDAPTCAFIDITDFHLDKLDIHNNTIEYKLDQYNKLLDTLLFKAYQSNHLEEIAFVIGSDMLHTDNIFNQTTKGTQQEVIMKWNDSFDMAFDIYVQSINKLKQFCEKLNVILVSGNHGRTKEYYLAFALKKYFENEPNIKFDISTDPRKVFMYGNTFIGLHHGNTKIENLPIVFAKEFAPQWGVAKYHEIKVGDKHHFMEKDYHGVRIKQLPACSNADSWHNDNNFVNSVQSAICSIYDKVKGRCMDIEERI